MMKQKMSVLLVGWAVMSLLIASVAMAKGTPGIRYTIHNMASTNALNYYKGSTEDEICIYCHTPHGGSLTGPLWNRPTAVGSTDGNDNFIAADLKSTDYFTHYNSATLTAFAGGNNRVVNDESLLCMTCHDGTIAVNRVLNVSNRTAPDATWPEIRIDNTSDTWAALTDTTMSGLPGKIIGSTIEKMGIDDRTGGDLSDDHPISFHYSAALASDIGLRSLEDAQAAGVRFFGGDRVECSTCHDPHVDYGDATFNSPGQNDPEIGRASCRGRVSKDL